MLTTADTLNISTNITVAIIIMKKFTHKFPAVTENVRINVVQGTHGGIKSDGHLAS